MTIQRTGHGTPGDDGPSRNRPGTTDSDTPGTTVTSGAADADAPGANEPAAGSTLKRNIGNVAAASAVALIVGELITFVQTIALARLLSPAEVGIFVAGTVLATFLGNFVEGGLRSGLIHRETDIPQASETVFWVTAIAGLAMSLGVLAASPLVGMAFHDHKVGLIAAASSGVLFLYAFTNVPEALLQRAFSVKRRLIVGPSVAVAYASVAVSLAAAGWGVWSMVAGMYASYVVWVATLWLICDWRPGRARASVALWRELASYGLPLVLGMIGARIQTMVESVVVGRGLSETDLGYYRYGQRVSMIPVSAIIEIGSIALFPAFSRIASEPERLKPAYLRALRWAMVGAAAVSALMVAIGVPSVVVVFGDPWRNAGVVVVAMAGLGVGKALICVSEEVIKGGGRTKLLNWYTALEVTSGILLLLALIRPFGLIGAGVAVSTTAIIVGITVVGLARPVVRYQVREVVAVTVPQLPCAAIAGTATFFLEHEVLHSDTRMLLVAIAFLTLDVVVFGLIYLATLFVVMPTEVRSMLRQTVLLLSRLRSRMSPAEPEAR